MKKNNPDITPETKVAELLEAHPQTEETLLRLSPTFAKLKNPVLRHTVARVTSLQQAAKVGGVSIVEMVDELRKVAGLPPLGEKSLLESEDAGMDLSDASVFEKKVTHRFDARPVIAAGNHPKEQILALAEALREGECLEFVAPFPPMPIIDILRKKGFRATMAQPHSNEVRTYVER